jgi:diacylglycerol kinase (ATP)
MTKHLFIVNPAAGGKDHTDSVRAQAKRAFAGRRDPYEIYVTSAPMDATAAIRREAAVLGPADRLRVYACGGDGTLNECVNGAAGLAQVAVTHFPCGTGNDFIKMFGGEKARFLDLPQLLDGEARPLDVIDVNGRYSVNICSVGIDARIGTQVHAYSHLPLIGGAGGYAISTVVNVVRGVARPLRIRCGKFVYTGDITLVCACNGRYYGGMFNPMPTARPDDGLIDFLVVRKVSRLTFARLVGKYARGRWQDMGHLITHLRGADMEIESDDELVVNVDGERVYGKSVHFRLLPGGVNFIFPREMEFFAQSQMPKEELSSKSEISAGKTP